MANPKDRHNGGGTGRDLTDIAAAQISDAELAQAVTMAIQLSGAANAFRFSSASNRVHEILVLQQIRDQESYKALGHTWETYCKDLLGRPRSSVDEDIQNLDVLGEEFMQLAAGIGLSRSAFRMLRRLPDGERPRLLESGVLEVGDQRIPIDRKHQDDIRDVIEGLLSNQDKLRANLELGAEQLKKLEDANRALDSKVTELQNPHRAEGVTDVDRQFNHVFMLLKDIAQEINRKAPGTEPERVLRWVRRISAQFTELTAYAANWQPMTDAPEGVSEEDLAEIERIMREDEDAH